MVSERTFCGGLADEEPRFQAGITGQWSVPFPTGEAFMKTRGEIEAAICELISRFEQEYLGRRPKDSQSHAAGRGMASHSLRNA
jgi:hypothetical protein